MQIDIAHTLRRLLCAGAPLLAAACQQGSGLELDRAALAGSERCTERALPGAIVEGATGKLKATLVISPSDDRWADFYAACMERSRHCMPLCLGALDASGLVPPGQGSSLSACSQSSCSEQGRPVLYVTYGVHSLASVGRRPERFSEPEGDAADPCGAWLARAAALEAASIPAFGRLARELEAQGAPATLTARARAAMRDEARHYQVMRRLARRYGATASRPWVAPGSVRPALAMALENIVEGCVNETYGALLAHWQAEHAGDPHLRAAMAGIAEDETGHAQLSWDVADFLLTRLQEAERREVAVAFADAASALVAAAQVPVGAVLVERLGLPGAEAGAALADALMTSLGARAAA